MQLKLAVGTAIDLVYADQVKMERSSGTEQLPPLNTLGSFTDIAFSIKDEDGVSYTKGTDFDVSATGEISWIATGAAPATGKKYAVNLGDAAAYGTDYNKFYLGKHLREAPFSPNWDWIKRQTK